MKKIKYNHINGRYTEAVINMSTFVLYFTSLIYDPENKLHIYYLAYDEHPDKPCWIISDPNSSDNIYGSIISPFPLNIRDGNMSIFDYDFPINCRYVAPEDVDRWIEKQRNIERFEEKDTLDDIEDTIYRFGFRGVGIEDVKKFFLENSFYFAVLLKEKIGNGFVMVDIPNNHVVWVNSITGKAYDANGKYEPNFLIPTYAEINGVKASKTYHLGKSDIKFSDDDYKALKETYKNWFPNA